jgi:hypothetical protein
MEGKTKAGFIFISISLFFFGWSIIFYFHSGISKTKPNYTERFDIGPFSIGELENKPGVSRT